MQTRLWMIVIKKKETICLQLASTHLGKTSCDRHWIEIRKEKKRKEFIFYVYLLGERILGEAKLKKI
jgi:hypothetical protein